MPNRVWGNRVVLFSTTLFCMLNSSYIVSGGQLSDLVRTVQYKSLRGENSKRSKLTKVEFEVEQGRARGIGIEKCLEGRVQSLREGRPASFVNDAWLS